MKIRMHVKEGGFVAFVCEGVLKEPVEKIVLNKDTRFVSLFLKDSGEEIKLDCPIDDELISAIGNHSHCAVGFCEGNNILAAAMVSFEGVGQTLR